MKKYLFLGLLILIMSCSDDPKYTEPVTLEMNMVDGKTYVESFYIPKNSFLYIRTDRGSYRLCWESRDCYWGCNPSGNTLKPGVINFKYLTK